MKIVRGNKARLTIPLEIVTITDGKEVRKPYYPSAEVVVRARNSLYVIPLDYTVSGNVMTVDVPESLQNGTYAVEIVDADKRSMRRAQFQVVETNDDASLPPPVEFGYTVATLDAHVYLSTIPVAGQGLRVSEEGRLELDIPDGYCLMLAKEQET